MISISISGLYYHTARCKNCRTHLLFFMMKQFSAGLMFLIRLMKVLTTNSEVNSRLRIFSANLVADSVSASSVTGGKTAFSGQMAKKRNRK